MGSWAPVTLLGLTALAVAACSPTVTAPVAAAHQDQFVLAGTTNLRQVAQLTGADSLNHTDRVDVGGLDLGSMTTMDGRTYFAFGDTFGKRPDNPTGAGGENWRSNVMAVSTDTDPTDGIRFDSWVTGKDGKAKELLPSAKVDGKEMTKIPTHGFAVGHTLYLAYMSVRHWGDPGEWDANYSSLARSTDRGRTWTLLDDVRWPGDGGFVQVAPAHVVDGGVAYLYLWGIPAGRFGGLRLMRVPEDAVEDLASYRYFSGTDATGSPLWSPDLGAAQLVVDDQVGEPSVVWNAYLQRWLLTAQQANGSAMIWEGTTPWHWSTQPRLLVDATEHPGLYAPFMNPAFVTDGGHRIYFALSLWGPYNVFWYSVDLVKT
ncbi:MAG: DUF4185 domain-containing protein [Janthinobacterium lividum]